MTELNQSLAEARHALDRLSFGVWLMDAALQLQWLNRMADDALADGTYGLSLRGNRLSIHSRSTASQMLAMARNLVENRSCTETLRINQNGACLVMTLSRKSDTGFQVGRSATSAILCFLLDPSLPAQLNQAQLRAIYQLTPAELRLAGLLVTGLDVAEASALLKVSPHTGRSHLKSIMQKTGVNRQTQLQRKLLICASTLGHADD
jgi:DNA-binding CsgD family transcriptional regulator